MQYDKKSKFGVKNHEFVMRYIKQNSGERDLPPYEYDPSTGLVHINGSFRAYRKKLKNFRGIKFGIILGDFDCSNNDLSSTEGFPIEVHGDFKASSNRLKSLVGGPKIVKGDYDVACNRGQIVSLEGCPREIGGDFDCSCNDITSLEFGPKKVKGSYHCDRNVLKNLKGAPSRINGSFMCNDNELETLEGSPSIIKGYFDFQSNKLKSLVGGPKEVGGNYDFSNNQVESFDGLPKLSGGSTVCANENGMSIRALEGLPLYVKDLEFENNDPFISYNICSEFIEDFLKNRNLSMSVAKFKNQIKEEIEEKKRDVLHSIEATKNRIYDSELHLKEQKKDLETYEAEYQKIKDDKSADDFINSFASHDLQKGVGALSKFGIF